jgi:hypothetical protein
MLNVKTHAPKNNVLIHFISVLTKKHVYRMPFISLIFDSIDNISNKTSYNKGFAKYYEDGNY